MKPIGQGRGLHRGRVEVLEWGELERGSKYHPVCNRVQDTGSNQVNLVLSPENRLLICLSLR